MKTNIRKDFSLHTTAIATVCTIVGIALSISAAPFYSESFDYGNSTVGFNSGSVGTWSSGSGVLKYDHDGGLDHPQMEDETGGAMWLDFADSRTASDSSLSFAMSSINQNDEVWVSSLFQYVAGNNNHQIEIDGGSVSPFDYRITGAGDVTITTTLDTNLNASFDTGIDAVSGTYLMLFRFTKGSGASPTDSQIDLWFDPTDTSSVAALGAADWTLDSGDGQVKWGRDGETWSSITAQPSQQGRIDEIRMGYSLLDVGGLASVIPEPSTAILAGLGLLGVCFRRRRSA